MTRGRRLRVAVPALPDFLDRERYAGSGAGPGNTEAHAQCYERLVGYDWRGPGSKPEFQGRLAESWSVSDEGRCWVFHLRHNVLSHAGHPLQAEDVVWSWRRAAAVGSVGEWMVTMVGLESADDIDCLDEHAVRFRLRRPSPSMLDVLAVDTPTIFDSVEACAHASPEDPWASDWLKTHDAGHGPFRFAGYDGSEAVLEATGSGAVTEVRYVGLSSPEERVAALIDGAVDLVAGVPADCLAVLEKAPGIQVESIAGGNCLSLQLSLEPPLNHQSVRRAIAHALPYEALASVAYHGRAQRWFGLIPPFCAGFIDAPLHWQTDLAAAKRDMDLAGLTQQSELRLTVPGMAGPLAEAGETIVRSLESIGLKVLLDPRPGPDYWQASGGYQLALQEGAHMSPNPIYALCHDYAAPPRSITNRTGYVNASFEALADQLFVAPEEQTPALVAQAQQVLLEDTAACPIALPPYSVALRDDVQGYRFSPSFPISYADLS